ncbi:MAG: hypothetical protein ACREEG_03090 [Phenylobacterium sp.]
MTQPADPLERFMGAAIMAVGLLIALLCGTCTAYFTIGSLRGMGNQTGVILMALLLGGTPTLIGVAMFRYGLNLFRGKPALRPSPPPNIRDDGAGGEP